jgi:ferredoxin
MKDLATVVQGIKYSDYEEKIKEAAESCPVEVIRYVD